MRLKLYAQVAAIWKTKGVTAPCLYFILQGVTYVNIHELSMGGIVLRIS